MAGAQSGKPYLLWVHVYDPHAPYQPPSPYKEQYKDRPYDGEIAYTDHELGRLFDAIRKKSPADKTLIAILSDHGESLGEHGEYTHGVFLYDATLRIAFMLAGPGVPSWHARKATGQNHRFAADDSGSDGWARAGYRAGCKFDPIFSGQGRSYRGVVRRDSLSEDQHGVGGAAWDTNESLEIHPRAQAGAVRSFARRR